MLKQVRQNIIHTLWECYLSQTEQMRRIDAGLKQKNIPNIVLDHLAIIDLPGPHSGIQQLREIFAIIGYIDQGDGYLPEKQNDFHWMAEEDCADKPAQLALAQVVVADFRLNEMPDAVKSIIEKYSQQAQLFPFDHARELASRAKNHDANAIETLSSLITRYLTGRDWPLPTVREFRTVQAFNELLAWVLVHGRRPNHFTLSVHHLPDFSNIADFHSFISNELHLTLNKEGGITKGGPHIGIAQGSTSGTPETVQLQDGSVELPMGFVEFVWRFARDKSQTPRLWRDYYNGFVPQYADRVIESLYLNIC